MGHENDLPAPPDGGYGWVMVLAIFWNNAHHWGILSSYGVFIQWFLAHPEYISGTYLDYALIGGLAASQSCLIAPLASTLHHRYGLKFAMGLGVLLQTAALLGAAWSTSIWQLYLSQGVCYGWGLGLQYSSSTSVIPQWFSTRRSLAAGITTAGTGTGGLIYSLAANAMLDRLGPGWTYRILAIVQGVVSSLCVFALRDSPVGTAGRNQRRNDTRSIDFRIGRRYEVWLFLGWSFFSVMGFMVIWFSLATFSRSVGLSATQGSVVTAVMNVGQIVGRPAVGYYSDAVGRVSIAAAATFVAGVLCLSLWVCANSYAAVLCFALFGGSLFGTFWTVMAPLSAEVVALKDVRSCLTLMWLVCVLPATFGEAIGLELRTSGDRPYLRTQLFTGFMYIGASLCVALLRVWKARAGGKSQLGVTGGGAYFRIGKVRLWKRI
ncbi:major facilitator superfamily domain-containing protein [Aspergillus aurantiobrunneus]